jgi:hypothetical protein
VEFDKPLKSRRPKKITIIHCGGNGERIHRLQMKSLQKERVCRRLKLSKPEELKWILAFRSKGMQEKCLWTSSKNTLGESECPGVENSQSPKNRSEPQPSICEGHTSTYHHLRVKAFQEKARTEN